VGSVVVVVVDEACVGVVALGFEFLWRL